MSVSDIMFLAGCAAILAGGVLLGLGPALIAGGLVLILCAVLLENARRGGDTP